MWEEDQHSALGSTAVWYEPTAMLLMLEEFMIGGTALGRGTFPGGLGYNLHGKGGDRVPQTEQGWRGPPQGTEKKGSHAMFVQVSNFPSQG